MSAKDDQSPATKANMKSLETKLTGDMKSLETKLTGDMKALKTEIIQEVKEHFDLAIEIIRSDLLGANRDEIEVIKDRVTRLEDHTGLERSR